MLEIRNLHVHYGKVYALQGVSLHAEKGETVAVLGANGAGKTTLLNTIVGILRPSSGEVVLDGRSIQGRPAHEVTRYGIGYAPEGRRVFADMTVFENLAVGAYVLRDRRTGQENLRLVYDLFPVLRERRNQMAGTLSGGEQQMLAIGRALMSSPRLLLLDEPSLGLAPLAVKVIFRSLEEIGRLGTTVLLVEQSAVLALKVASRAYVLESGHVTMEGSARELAGEDSVRKAYLGA